MNDAVDHHLVEEIFLEALELESGARAELLDERCGGDADLRAEVESLLASHEGPGLVPEMEEERPFGGRYPDRMGAYRIVRPLGEGGMGVVLLAIREGPGFEQTVALKLLRHALPDPHLARRLEEERRILARLEHPGIARFVDGGVTEDGEPYYAMEYVQGDDILIWCDERGLDLPERLDLFAQVCDAVHHAHHQLVVHRDIKPSNILVTPEGKPKLLDFGIAKSLENVAPGEETARWLTGAYASPEQIRGDTVTTLSDVYALGVLLCELVSGHRPYDTSAASLEQLTRVILHDPPAKPSDLAEDGRRARALRGDLDMIVAKALSKEPERRYDSARDLADDVRRFLEGRPIEARPDSTAYRFRKFYRRHRALVGAAAVLLLALVGGTLAVAWQARVATAQRDRAEVEAERARQVTALMTDIFRLGDPTATRGDTVGVQQVLREGVTRVESALQDDPVLQATLLLELGRIYRNLGLVGEAERLAGRALALRETHEPGSLAHADALGFQGLVLLDAGAVDRAMPHLEEAVEMRDALVPGPDTVTATLLNSLGWEVRALGEPERARAMFERALEIRRAALGDGDPAVANTMLGLAATFHDQGHFDETEEIFRTALAVEDLEPSPVTSTALVNLGMISRLRERYREAEPLLRAGYGMALDLFGREHPAVLDAAEQLGVALAALGRYAEADRLLAENLRIAVATLDEAHPQTRGAREALATVDHALGRFALAAARHDSVVVAKAEARGGDHPGVVYSLVNAGDAWLDAGAVDTAEARYRASLEMGARLGGNEGVYGMLARHGLARVALQRGEVAGADSLLSVAIAIGAEELRADHRYLLELERTRARILLLRGRPARARQALEPVLAAERAHRPSPHPRIGRTLALLADALEAEGDDAGAVRRRAEAREELSGLPTDHPDRRALASGPPDPSRGSDASPRASGEAPDGAWLASRRASDPSGVYDGVREPSGRGSAPLQTSPTRSVGANATTTPVPGARRP